MSKECTLANLDNSPPILTDLAASVTGGITRIMGFYDFFGADNLRFCAKFWFSCPVSLLNFGEESPGSSFFEPSFRGKSEVG